MIPVCPFCHSPNVRIKAVKDQLFLICKACGKITDISDGSGGATPLNTFEV